MLLVVVIFIFLFDELTFCSLNPYICIRNLGNLGVDGVPLPYIFDVYLYLPLTISITI